jgi:predicted O-methyltransferase YrrM
MTGRADRLRRRAAREGFDASSTPEVGGLLAETKPGGTFLELGTGAGLGTASRLNGMSETARLVTIELSEALSRAAQEEITDPRVEWVIADGGQWPAAQQPRQRRYDLVFAVIEHADPVGQPRHVHRQRLLVGPADQSVHGGSIRRAGSRRPG